MNHYTSASVAARYAIEAKMGMRKGSYSYIFEDRQGSSYTVEMCLDPDCAKIWDNAVDWMTDKCPKCHSVRVIKFNKERDLT
jgi:hypothetical protein